MSLLLHFSALLFILLCWPHILCLQCSCLRGHESLWGLMKMLGICRHWLALWTSSCIMIWACNIPLFLIIALKKLLQVSFVFFSVGFSHHVGFLINLPCNGWLCFFQTAVPNWNGLENVQGYWGVLVYGGMEMQSCLQWWGIWHQRQWQSKSLMEN